MAHEGMVMLAPEYLESKVVVVQDIQPLVEE